MVALVYLGQVLPVGEGGSVLGGCVRGGLCPDTHLFCANG